MEHFKEISVYTRAHAHMHASVCLSVCLSVFICLRVSPQVCPSTWYIEERIHLILPPEINAWGFLTPHSPILEGVGAQDTIGRTSRRHFQTSSFKCEGTRGSEETR